MWKDYCPETKKSATNLINALFFEEFDTSKLHRVC